MQRFSRHVRLAIGLVALAVPLLGATAAQGAMGTSHTLNTTQLADLVSATALNNSQVDYCFDDNNTSISPVGALTPGNWQLGGYDANNLTPAASSVAISQPTPHCIRVTFSGGAPGFDMSHYSYATVTANQVKSNQVPGGPNLQDSVPLIEPASQNTNHNGTAGLSAGPDLQTVVDQSGNQMAYLFDQRINNTGFAAPCPGGGGTINATRFRFIQSSGAVVSSDAAFCALADSPFGTNSAVVVSFAPANSTATGIWFLADDVTVNSATPAGGGNNNRPLVVHNPSNSAATTPPTLVSSNLVNGGDSTDMLFNYDKPVNLGLAARCFAIASNGAGNLQGQSEAQFDSDTIQVTFPAGSQNVMEEIVQAVDFGGNGTGGCANSTAGAPPPPSTGGGVPAGGNSGAFSYGYTTAAEAQSLTVDRATNRVFVTLDQRIIGTTGAAPNIVLANIRLIGPDGSPGASPNSASVPSQGPGPQVLTLTFGAGQIPAGTFGVQLLAGAISTPGPVGAFYTGQFPNVPQVFALN